MRILALLSTLLLNGALLYLLFLESQWRYQQSSGALGEGEYLRKAKDGSQILEAEVSWIEISASTLPADLETAVETEEEGERVEETNMDLKGPRESMADLESQSKGDNVPPLKFIATREERLEAFVLAPARSGAVEKSKQVASEKKSARAPKRVLQKGEKIEQLQQLTVTPKGVASEGQNELAERIEQSLYSFLYACYPESSKRRGEEGVAKISLQFNQGKVVGIQWGASTGFSRLDRCAEYAVTEAAKRALKAGLYQDFSGTIRMKPIRFSLR